MASEAGCITGCSRMGAKLDTNKKRQLASGEVRYLPNRLSFKKTPYVAIHS